MSRLADRLARLRKSGLSTVSGRSGAAESSRPGPTQPGPTRPGPTRPGAARRGPARRGPVRRVVGADEPPPGDGWRRVDDFVWERRTAHSGLLPERLRSGFIVDEGTPADRLVFYDLETTGLSGGVGNIAFLIGAACQEADRSSSSGSSAANQQTKTLTVTQLFLSDYPGETAMLERLRELFTARGARVSYNGRCFDSQVIRNRFLLNRLRPPDDSGAGEVDLLYPARRLWRGRLPDLSLARVEADVLGVHRSDDLPGSEAPDAWFEWLARGAKGYGVSERITGVLRHNHDDVMALVRLLAHLEEWGGSEPDVEAPGKAAGAAPSYRGTAAQWFPRDAERALEWLEAGWARGERECGRPLAHQLKRRGEWRGARRIWEALDRPGERDYYAAVELAKLHEHRLRDPAAALDVLRGLPEEPLGERRREELKKRRGRLERKTANKNSHR